VQAIEAAREGGGIQVTALQDLHPHLAIPLPPDVRETPRPESRLVVVAGRLVAGIEWAVRRIELDVAGWRPAPGQFVMLQPQGSPGSCRAVQHPSATGRGSDLPDRAIGAGPANWPKPGGDCIWVWAVGRGST